MTSIRTLEPLPYQEAIREYLKAEEPEVWDWYASNRVREDQAEAVRFDLLKSTYRVDRESQNPLYQAAEEVAEQLSLRVPVTLYQAQNPTGLNASLAYIPNEAHIVLHGSVASKLTGVELRALLAHEFSHLLLWQDWDSEYLIVDQILAALTRDARADVPHFASARLFGLYNEIFCDRGSLLAVNDPLVVVSMLVKVHTGLDDVSAGSYLRQADEIFAKGHTKTTEVTHPEAFIRARAIKLWFDGQEGTNTLVEQMIEGPLALDELDLLGQRKVAAKTKRLLDEMTSHHWMRSDAVLAQTRMYFDDYSPSLDQAQGVALTEDWSTDDKSLHDYYCYVLLDFVTADRDLEEYPLAAALILSERLNLKDRFAEIAKQELRLRKKQFEHLDKEKVSMIAKVSKQAQGAE